MNLVCEDVVGTAKTTHPAIIFAILLHGMSELRGNKTLDWVTN